MTDAPLSALEQQELDRLQSGFDACAGWLDEVFEPRHVRLYGAGQRLLARLPSPARGAKAVMLAALIGASLTACVFAAVRPQKTPPEAVRYVQRPVTVMTRSVPDMTAEPVSGAVNVNTASADELITLPGIGPVTAQRIIDARDTYGPYHYPEDLLTVSGIGVKVLERLKPLITLEIPPIP